MPTLTCKPTAGRLVQAFGPRPRPTPTSPAFHYGQDWGWTWTTTDPIFAAAGGVVVSYEYVGAYGRRLVVRHDDGSEAWYCHTTRAHVSVGQRVEAGQHIADIGVTGNTVGPHLHFEIRVNGVAVDPAPLFHLTGPAGLPTEEIEPMPEYLTHTDARPRELPKGQWVTIYLNDENHASFVVGETRLIDARLDLQLEGAAGVEVKARLVVTEAGTNTVRGRREIREAVGNRGVSYLTFADLTDTGRADDGVRWQIAAEGEGVRLARSTVKAAVYGA